DGGPDTDTDPDARSGKHRALGTRRGARPRAPEKALRVGLGLEQLDRDRLAVGQLVGGRLADLAAVDRRAQRGLRRVHLELRPGLLARTQQELQRVLVVTVERDRDHHAGRGRPGLARGRADLRVLEQLAQLEGAGVHLALLLLGRVVAAVLPQVAFLAGGLDLLSDLDAVRTLEILQLGLQTVVRILGKPGDVIAGLGHDAPRRVGWRQPCRFVRGFRTVRYPPKLRGYQAGPTVS